MAPSSYIRRGNEGQKGSHKLPCGLAPELQSHPGGAPSSPNPDSGRRTRVAAGETTAPGGPRARPKMAAAAAPALIRAGRDSVLLGRLGANGAAAGLAVRGLPLHPKPGAGPGRRGPAALRREALRARLVSPGGGRGRGRRRLRRADGQQVPGGLGLSAAGL